MALCLLAGRMPFMDEPAWTLFDAGLFIGALLRGDPRHSEAHALVEAGRRGDFPVCTTVGILSEVYAALTWVGTVPPHDPEVAATAVRMLIAPPSAIRVLSSSMASAETMLQLASQHQLTACRIHDARHAAIAMTSAVTRVYTYDVDDRQVFTANGMRVVRPALSTLSPMALGTWSSGSSLPAAR